MPLHPIPRWRAIALAFLTLAATSSAWAQEPVPRQLLDSISLQLKWKQQFQFAGYYAALEKGFYQDAGLDVEIREGGSDVDVAWMAAIGRADFAVCTSEVLPRTFIGQEFVVMAVIFQHS